MPQILVIVFALLAVAYGQEQQQTLNTTQKSPLRVCLDVAGSKNSGDYDELIYRLSGTVVEDAASSPTTVIAVPLFKEAPDRCDYILHVGTMVSYDYTNEDYHTAPLPRAGADVEFSLFRSGSDKAIMHDSASVVWNASTQGQESKLIPIVAQRTLKAIEKDQRQSAKPRP